MKIMLAATAAVLALTASPTLAETVTVTLTGVHARPGPILATLATRDQFMREGSYVARAAAAEGQVVLTFENVAPGEYALMVMHDENSNGQFDMAASEGWAFSNSTAPMTGMPTFDQHRFTVGEAPVRLTETLRYGF